MSSGVAPNVVLTTGGAIWLARVSVNLRHRSKHITWDTDTTAYKHRHAVRSGVSGASRHALEHLLVG